VKNLQAALGFIFVILLIDVIGIGIIIPVLPGLISEVANVDNSTSAIYGGYLLVAYSIMQFLFSPLIGALSDRYGRRPILLMSSFGIGLDFLLMAYAPTLSLLFVGRLIAGILGGSFTTGAAYIADVSTPEKRAQNFGLIGVAFGLGFAVGPMIGGILGEYGTRVPFMAAASLSMINWLYGLFILPESLPEEKRRKMDLKSVNPLTSLTRLKRYPKLSGLIFSLVFVYIASHAVQSTWSYFTFEAFEWSTAQIGYSLGFVGVMSIIVQGGLIRIVIPKFGQERSIYLGMVLYAIGLVLFSTATQGWLMYPYLAVYCLGGIAGPALQGLMSNQVSDSEQGELQGSLTSMMSVTSIIGPWIMTTLFAFFTAKGTTYYFPGAPMLLGVVLVLIGLFFSYRALNKE
jgi:MFS transporter, DHA1 family, tetracycline resistance protein